jgi:transcriptional regulator with XRE-family HTH domain
MLLLIKSPSEVCRELALRVRALRLELGWTQRVLSRRAGVALSTLRHFERTGQISLERLVMIASSLSALDAFEGLLQPPRAGSLEEIEARQAKRQRGRRADA